MSGANTVVYTMPPLPYIVFPLKSCQEGSVGQNKYQHYTQRRFQALFFLVEELGNRYYNTGTIIKIIQISNN